MHTEREIYLQNACNKRDELIMELTSELRFIKANIKQVKDLFTKLINDYKGTINKLTIENIELNNQLQDLLLENEFLKHKFDSIDDLIKKNGLN